MTSQLSFLPDAEAGEADLEDVDPREPSPEAVMSEAEFDRLYGSTDPCEYAGLFPGVIISEGVPIATDEIEEAKRVERKRQDAEHKKTTAWQCEEKNRKAVAEAQQADETRRRNAERAAQERQQTAEARRAAMSRGART